MARWEGGAPDRLRAAAIDLFATRGFDATTVADIAAAAGLTERTFFRHYIDKREVLFQGQDVFEQAFVDGLYDTDSDDPMAMVRGALAGAGAWFDDERRPTSRTRQLVIDANEGLRERERLKLGTLAERLADALAHRGVDPASAVLAAETGMAVFHTAFVTWIAEGETRSFTEVLDDVLSRLRNLAAG